jgi:type I restriction enzyme S subunit
VAERLNLPTIRQLPVAVPPLPEQRTIAHILGTLDDKIELNRQMNETLEAIARVLFKSWFIDFDPVRRNTDRSRNQPSPRPTSHPSPHGRGEGDEGVVAGATLPPLTLGEGWGEGSVKELDRLFPNSFVDSELGEIPKGWAVSPLRNLAGYLSRGIGPAYVNVGGICVLNQKCVRDRRVDFSKARRHDPSKKSSEGRTLRVLDILVNSTGVGTLGRIAQLWDLPESAIVDSHVTVIRAAEGIDPWFLGIALIGREADVEALGEGSTGQTELSRTRLGELTCLAPPAELQSSFGHLVGPVLSRVSANERVAITVAALRDTLLPKLISGELRVKDGERVCERVGA